ncbi:hypothetical protein EW146_g5942 [Bondarzewia mesenterica]|uniref:Uncharacterized protein n=1 Tax=Bondarzewia mesenterica TaxID=1095465 RepID=A0A4S4LPZ3_9AGAM|nr:hypothetical protein EW146_g5942 [Bondarzewia mesenterica]
MSQFVNDTPSNQYDNSGRTDDLSNCATTDRSTGVGSTVERGVDSQRADKFNRSNKTYDAGRTSSSGFGDSGFDNQQRESGFDHSAVTGLD